MSDITFDCPHCGQSLAVEEDMLGETITCPACSNEIELEGPETKVCPFCAEEVKFEALKCKHCGSMLDGSEQKPATAGPTQPTDQEMLNQTAFMLFPGERVMMEGLVSYVKSAINCADSSCYVTNYRLVLSAKGLLGPAMFGAIGIAASRIVNDNNTSRVTTTILPVLMRVV